MGMEMTCPKCHAKMRQFERNGVTIDQCTECRGIFLDRGELEHLIDADAKFNAGNPPPAAAAAGPPPTQSAPPPVAPAPGHYPPPASPYGHGQPYYKHSYGHGYGYKRKRRKSFFEELFD